MLNKKSYTHTAIWMPRSILAALTLVAALSAASAQQAGSADPFSIWDHTDNPAAWGFFPDTLALGIRSQALVGDIAAFSGGTFPGTLDAVIGMPGVLYRFTSTGTSGSHEVTSSFGLGEFISMGLRGRWNTPLPSTFDIGSQDLGLIARPLRYLSVSLGIDDIFDYDDNGFDGISMGVAARPLAFNDRLGSLLTLSADAKYSPSGFSFDSVGARFSLDNWLSIRGGYAPGNGSLGLSATVALSGSETSAGATMVMGNADPQSVAIDAAQSVRLGRSMKSAGRVFNGATLYMDNPGMYASTPPLFNLDTGLIESPIWVGQAIAAIEKAVFDPTIHALVMVEPPLFESEARGQEFSRALKRFKEAGKQVYVFATMIDRLSYIYAASGADVIALDPNGMLPIVDVASFSFYLKNLFDRLGIDLYNLQSHDTKTAYNMYTESGITEAERSMKARFIGGLAKQGYAYLDTARGAKLATSAAATIGSGPYLNPDVATKAGLIDVILYQDEFEKTVDDLTVRSSILEIERYARETDQSWGQPTGRRVAVVYLSGNIILGDGLAGVSIGESSTELLAALRDDPFIAGVILRVDSGGGSALTSDHIARQVKLIGEAGKPVVVSMASYAASGGYYIAAYADTIVAEAGTLTGSIGVTGLNFNASRLLDKLDIGADIVSAGSSGAFGNIFMPYRAEDGEQLTSAIEYTYNRFIDVVAEGRGMDKARVDELGKGQIWLGSEALENGLVDVLGGMDEAKVAMEKLLGSKAVYLDYLPGAIDMETLAGMLGLEAGNVLGAAIDTGRFIEDLSDMGDGLLYLAPEYLERSGNGQSKQ